MLEEIEEMYEYLLDPHLRKNGKYVFKNYESKKEKDDDEDYPEDVGKLDRITDSIVKGVVYHRGLYINPTYTTIAHFWLLNRMLNYNKLNIISDNDSSLKNAIPRVFKDEVKNKKVNIFVTQLSKKIKLHLARRIIKSLEYTSIKDTVVINELTQLPKGFRISSYDYLIEKQMNELEKGIYEFDSNTGLPIKSLQREHIKPSSDEGGRLVHCLNDLTYLSKEDIAKLFLKVNIIPLNGYHTELRYKINALEKTKTSSRGEGKQYQHSPKNLRYVQYLLTIYRVYHNFCKLVGNEKKT